MQSNEQADLRETRPECLNWCPLCMNERKKKSACSLCWNIRRGTFRGSSAVVDRSSAFRRPTWSGFASAAQCRNCTLQHTTQAAASYCSTTHAYRHPHLTRTLLCRHAHPCFCWWMRGQVSFFSPPGHRLGTGTPTGIFHSLQTMSPHLFMYICPQASSAPLRVHVSVIIFVVFDR